jgi:hypothetical protein
MLCDIVINERIIINSNHCSDDPINTNVDHCCHIFMVFNTRSFLITWHAARVGLMDWID